MKIVPFFSHSETGQPEEALNKDFLARELGMKEDGSSM